jgi:hypothetical protein
MFSEFLKSWDFGGYIVIGGKTSDKIKPSELQQSTMLEF